MPRYKNLYYKNRWFALGLLALAINIWGVIRYTGSSSSVTQAAEGQISILTPAAGQAIQADEPLELRFPSPMIEEAYIGTWQETGPIGLKPFMDGSWYWKAADHVVFMPSKNWAFGETYALSLQHGLRDLDGQRVKPIEQSIHTEELRCISLEQTDFNARRQATLRLRFNHPPNRDSLKKHLSIKRASNQSLDFQLIAGDTPEEVLVQTGVISGAKIGVRLGRGVMTAEGKVGMVKSYTHTLQFADTLRLIKARAYSYAFEANRLELHFTASLDQGRAREFITITPPVNYSIHTSGSRLHLKGDFEPGQTYHVHVRKGLPAQNGTKLEAELSKSLYFSTIKPALALRERGRYLSPNGHMRLAVDSNNLSSILGEAHRIYPNNLVYFVNRHSKYSSAYRQLSHKIAEHRYPVKAEKNQLTRTPLELNKLLNDHGTGVYMIGLSANENLSARQLVVVTDIGITVKRSDREILVWANRIHDLSPIRQGTVKIYSKKNQVIYTAETDSDGLAIMACDKLGEDHQPYLVTVQEEEDISWLGFNDTHVNGLANVSGRDFVNQGYEAFVFTDRGIYRPGETIHAKTIIRGKDLACPDAFPVRLKVIRPDGRLWREWTETLNPFGSAGFDVELDEYLPTGRFTLQCTLPGDDHILGTHKIAVESFVPPQIRVAVKTEDTRVTAMEELSFEVQAEHLFGAKAQGLPLSAWVIYRSIPFAPNNWAAYQFGDVERPAVERRQSGITGKLDAEGRFKASVKMDWGRNQPAASLKALIGTSVKNMSGRSVTVYGSRIVDPSPFYIGIAKDALKQQKAGIALDIPLCTVQPDGLSRQDVQSLEVKVERVFYTRIRNRDQIVSEKRKEIVDSGSVVLNKGVGTWHLKPEHPGDYIIRVFDPVSKVRSAARLYVSEEAYDYALKADKPDQLSLELDQEQYTAGETALLTIKAPFTGKALIALEQGQLVRAWTRQLEHNVQTIELPIDASFAPNVYCSVTLIRPVTSEAEGVYRAAGRKLIPVIRPEQEMQVTIHASDIRPQSRLHAQVEVKNAAGQGEQVEIVFAAVDEGICMLTDHSVADPLSWFRRARRTGIRQYDQYQLLLPELDDMIEGAASNPGGGGSGTYRNRLNPISARRFKPVALWAGSVMTDENGRAQVELDVPELSGELRLMAVAINKKAFGRSERAIKVSRPTVIQQSLPRFLAPGDRFSIPLKVFNRSKVTRDIPYALKADGPVRILDGMGRMHLAPGSEKTIHLKAEAHNVPGKATIHFAVGADTDEDLYTESVEIAVRPAYGYMQVSHTGQLKPGESYEIRSGMNWLPGTAKERLYCAPRPDIALGGGLDYLLDYPYGCLEQTTSKSFPLLYMKDLLKATRPELAEDEALKDYVQAGIYRILGMQRSSGALSYWPKAETYAYGSVYAAHFLVEAKRAGYEVPAYAYGSLLDHLEYMAHKRIGETENLTNRSYALYVLALADRPDPGSIGRMTELVDRASVSARIHIVNALAASGKRKQAIALLKTIGLNQALSSPAETTDTLNTPTRDLALLLNAWLDLEPSAPLVTGLAQQLGKRRVRGQYYTTQENAYALLALGKYAQRNAGEVQEYVAEIDDGRQLKHTDRKATWIKDGLKLVNQGPGTLYYAVKSGGVPSSGSYPDEDANLAVRRSMFDLDGREINRDRFAQGEMVVIRIELTPQTPSIDNLVIEDLLPAGFEIENAGINLSSHIPWLAKLKRSRPRSIDVRDDRIVLFPNKLGGPTHYFYLARAVTPGTFIWPALQAECMYDAGIHSRNQNMQSVTVLQAGAVAPPQPLGQFFIETEAAKPFLLRPVRSTARMSKPIRKTSGTSNMTPLQPFVYVVQDGESLDDIARAFIVSAEDIRTLNNISGEVFSGDALSIPPSIF